jgi:alkanesulfonate monooxygenase SsuD/methylene tetrahydromethanopterin reductase-like flavin-dependent oxidoreductase (luciferase family)
MSEDRQRGKSAIDAAHTDASREDEAKIGAKISEIYRVGTEEAIEIHANYHAERIFAGLERRARENGMTREALAEKAQNLTIPEAAYQVATGQLAEAAAIDILFRNLYIMESNGSDNDRYVNFYG